jgi:hypothetical protein
MTKLCNAPPAPPSSIKPAPPPFVAVPPPFSPKLLLRVDKAEVENLCRLWDRCDPKIESVYILGDHHVGVVSGDGGYAFCSDADDGRAPLLVAALDFVRRLAEARTA